MHILHGGDGPPHTHPQDPLSGSSDNTVRYLQTENPFRFDTNGMKFNTITAQGVDVVISLLLGLLDSHW